MANSAGPSDSKRRREDKGFYMIDSDMEDEICGGSEDEDLLAGSSSSYSSDEDAEAEEEQSYSTVDAIPHPSQSDWSPDSNLRTIQLQRDSQFFSNPGDSPIDYFNFFMDDSFCTLICDETNAQAARLIAKGTKIKSRLVNWKDLTVSTFRVFLGLLFHMGTIPLSRLNDYWRTDPLLQFPMFSSRMSRNKFLLIMRCLHFTSEEISNDPLFKIRSAINHFNNKMSDCYYPGKQLSIDESMVLWRGRLKFRQYIKNKRHKYGVKLYMLTEPDGLVLKFRVYSGSYDADVAGKGHAEKVVMALMEQYLNNGHSIFMDNYYNSFSLARALLNNNTYCTGTLRLSRKDTPKDVVNKNLKKGENISRFKEGVHIGKWKDKRAVAYITTEFGNSNITNTNRHGAISEKPEAIVYYNKFMAGVDRHDQLQSYYPCERKTLRWYLKIGIHIFQMLLLNSHKLYNKYSGKPKLSLFNFRLSVIRDLLASDGIRESTPRPSTSISLPHKITKTELTTSTGRLMRRRCKLCWEKFKKRKDTTFECKSCEENPPLCLECFDEYHRNQS